MLYIIRQRMAISFRLILNTAERSFGFFSFYYSGGFSIDKQKIVCLGIIRHQKFPTSHTKACKTIKIFAVLNNPAGGL